MRVLALLLLLMQPGQAFAHASLLEAGPADGSVLEAGPAGVRLRFDEPIGLIALTMVGPAGAVALLSPGVDGDTVRAGVPAGLARGTYLLSWRVTSVDSHAVAGTVAFGVGVAPEQVAAPTRERWLWPSMAVRGLFLAALLGAAGGVLFRAVAEPPARVRRGLAWLAWVGIGLAGLQVGVRGALLTDAPTLWGHDAWAAGVDTTLAGSLLVSAAGLLGCALGWRARAGWGAGAALVAVGGLALSGHAATAAPRALMAPALVLHAGAAALWVGAFWPLLGVLRGEAAGAAVQRFSARAVPAVAVLAGSGALLAAVQVGRWGALLDSLYGRVLLLKLGLAAGLLGLAALNRLR